MVIVGSLLLGGVTHVRQGDRMNTGEGAGMKEMRMWVAEVGREAAGS